MTRLPVLIMVGVFAAAPRACAACRWFGTQLGADPTLCWKIGNETYCH